jgi:predicted DNA binding CopG/RHH family protein
MSKKRIDIDEHEEDILKDFEAGDLVPVENNQEEIGIAKKAASNYLKRDSRINIRVSTADLNMVRRIAAQEGLPYQTLLASVIHKFVAGRLVDVNTRRS